MSDVLARINELFEDWMREQAGEIGKGGPGYWCARLGYLAGLAAGSGFRSDDEAVFLDGLADLYAAAKSGLFVSALLQQIPPEQRALIDEGDAAATDQGMIRVFTALEEANPTDAESIRKTRYYLQTKYRAAREQG